MAIGTALVVGGGIFSAVSQFASGQAKGKSLEQESEFNAQTFEQQMELIQRKKRITESQFNRRAAFSRGKVIAQTAGKGFELGGSPLAILIDNETQIQFDSAIAQHNLDIESNLAESRATQTRRQGKESARLARTKGTLGAFSTLLNTGVAFSGLSQGRPGSSPFALK